MNDPSTIDLSTSRRIHVVGAGGSGMSAIASVLHAMGHHVSGSDAVRSDALDRLQAAGIVTWTGHDTAALEGVEAVAISTAIPDSDAEMQEAHRLQIPVLRRSQLLPAIANTRRTVAVAGTHGKTTTSTLLAHALEAGGVKPSWIIGGDIAGKDGGAHWDSGAWFVVEADESDGTFLALGAEAVLVTNIEPDHLEHYGGWQQLRQAFANFVGDAAGARVLCADDEEAKRLADEVGAETYGHHASAGYRIVEMRLDRYSATFRIAHDDETTEPVTLHIAGAHNVSNATGAMALAHQVGVPLKVAAEGIGNFCGVGRRFQHRGEKAGVVFIDDYAHLPGEVKAAVSAARAGNWRRVVTVFQPHRYSRTEQVGHEFGGAFDGSDELILAGIYAAGEPARPGIDGRIVVEAVTAESGHPQVTYVEDRGELAEVVAGELREGDLCLTLGAGDVTKLADEVMALL